MGDVEQVAIGVLLDAFKAEASAWSRACTARDSLATTALAWYLSPRRDVEMTEDNLREACRVYEVALSEHADAKYHLDGVVEPTDEVTP